jgi:hypothetical protein
VDAAGRGHTLSGSSYPYRALGLARCSEPEGHPASAIGYIDEAGEHGGVGSAAIDYHAGRKDRSACAAHGYAGGQDDDSSSLKEDSIGLNHRVPMYDVPLCER